MPKYELMYILASSVSDDQVPAVTSQVKKFITDFGGTNVEETQLGKKKLAYPIKKTRNGYYVVVDFDFDAKNMANLDAKIHAQSGSIIRYIFVNLDEHLARLEKDKVAQSKLSKRPETTEGEGSEPRLRETADVETTSPEEKKAEPAIELTTEELDKKIEAALTEDLIK